MRWCTENDPALGLGQLAGLDARIDETLPLLQQAVDIGRVETCGRFVENAERVAALCALMACLMRSASPPESSGPAAQDGDNRLQSRAALRMICASPAKNAHALSTVSGYLGVVRSHQQIRASAGCPALQEALLCTRREKNRRERGLRESCAPTPETENMMAHPTSPTRSTAGSSRTTEAGDAISLLKDDHRAVVKLFDAFEKVKQTQDLDAKTTLVRRACEELTVHAMIEEELLYPAATEALDEDDRPDVEEAYVEHFLVKMLIEKFATLSASDAGFDATFKVMSEMVRHHIEEEESELFPKLRKSGADLVDLGDKLARRKAQLDARIPKDAGDNTMRVH